MERRCASFINYREQPDFGENGVPVTELVEECYREGVWPRSVAGAVESGECVCQYCEGQKEAETEL